MFSNIEDFFKEHYSKIILITGVILISLLSFAVGFITAEMKKREPIQIEQFYYE